MKYERTCLWCGASIIGRRSNVKYCCRTHLQRAKNARTRGTVFLRDRLEKICPICKGVIPYGTRPNKSFCSKRCQKRADNRGDPFGQNIFQPKTCVDCGVYFEHLQVNAKRCPECRHREIRNHHTHSRRCRKYSVPFESFSLLGVFHRDNWLCGICGLPAPRELRGTTDPRAPELDHIIPLSMGPGIGPGHVPSNCRCAHRKCNYDRNL